ncbi:MAG: hypothetical protein ACP5Q4_04825 [Candidatus Caldatribacteriaceae bacterium]
MRSNPRVIEAYLGVEA